MAGHILSIGCRIPPPLFSRQTNGPWRGWNAGLTSQMAKKCLFVSGAQLSRILSTPHHGLLTTQTQQRGLWGMLNAIFNKFDQNRVDEVGPDRAAAEWLLRCGAAVKFSGYEKWNDDYNTLPMGTKDRYLIEAVDATDSSIMHLGFEYFRGLERMRRLKLHHATYITDESMHKLEILKDCLQDLQVSSCGDISDKGLISLHKLSKLRYLFLCDLPAVKNMDTVLSTLRIALPNCEVRYLSLEGKKDLRKELSKDRELLRYIEESTTK